MIPSLARLGYTNNIEVISTEYGHNFKRVSKILKQRGMKKLHTEIISPNKYSFVKVAKAGIIQRAHELCLKSPE